MSLLDVKFEGWSIITVRVNWIAFIVLLLSVLAISFLIKKCMRFINKRSIIVDEVNLGIGNTSIKLLYDKKDQEIAYKLWVELSTRKIGIPFDRENDVIKEVYDSWYEFFGIARELLKEIPANKISYSSDLIQLIEKVLNVGLRPHLTTWQAKYRKWYKNEIETASGSPQEIQKAYPEYSSLVEDLVRTNEKMIEYKELMRKIAFQDE